MHIDPDLSFIKSDINLEDVAPIKANRTISFVNAYLQRMTHVMNEFAIKAEETLMKAELQLDRTDRKLQLLEAKLSLIPDDESEASTFAAPAVAAAPAPAPASCAAQVVAAANFVAPVVVLQTPEPQSVQPVMIQTPTAEQNGYQNQEQVAEADESAAQNGSGTAVTPTVPTEAPAGNLLKNKDDPAYAKYFKMLKLGVVVAGIRQKMMTEGVDPNILDDPEGISENAHSSTTREDEESN